MSRSPLRLLCTLSLLLTPTVGFASGPTFAVSHEGMDVFHQVGATEVIAAPVANQQDYYGDQFQPSPSNEYSGSAPVALPPLNIPAASLKCCQGDRLGQPCQVDRYLTKPSHVDPNCLVCVKEPYVDKIPVKEEVEVVIHRCFETKVPFKQDGCEDGTWYRKQGDKVIRRLRPCTTTVKVEYEKKVVRYRDVWYHVRCD